MNMLIVMNYLSQKEVYSPPPHPPTPSRLLYWTELIKRQSCLKGRFQKPKLNDVFGKFHLFTKPSLNTVMFLWSRLKDEKSSDKNYSESCLSVFPWLQK